MALCYASRFAPNPVGPPDFSARIQNALGEIGADLADSMQQTVRKIVQHPYGHALMHQAPQSLRDPQVLALSAVPALALHTLRQ